MIIGGLLAKICFWSGVYTIISNIVIPIINNINGTNNDDKTKK